MIGMMYLVLTALLALNVAAEVLNAFVLIDNSLRKTTDNAVTKNDVIYTSFEAAYNENPGKVKPYKDNADKIRIKSKELIDYIDTLKLKIVKTADGPEGDPTNISSKDDLNVPGQILLLEKVDGKYRGDILKEYIDKYKEFLISLIADKVKYKELVKSIEDNLSTADIIGSEGGKKTWLVSNFEHMPLVGVITLMSKMQADIRNSESDMLGYLFGQIDAGSFKFNNIEAIVSSPTNYVLKGQPYEAEVFIAASDSTVDPVIKINGSPTPLPVKNGKGIYVGATGSPGIKTWGGVIELKSPATGEMLQYKFQSEYQVGEASLVVSPTKMNVLFIGVDNPVDVSVPGVPENKIHPRISNGSIVKSGKGYVVRVKQLGTVNISASADIEGGSKNMGSKEFRVKKVPNPVPKIGGKNSGDVSKNWLTAQTGVAAVLEDFYFDLRFNVVSFNVSATIKGYVEDAKSSGPGFTSAQKSLIQKIPSRQKIYIEDVMAVGPDGTRRNIGSIVFKLN